MHAPPCVHVLVWGRRGNYIGGRVRLQRSKEHHGRAIGTREKRSAEKEEKGGVAEIRNGKVPCGGDV